MSGAVGAACLHNAPSFCCLYQLPVSPLNESASGVVDEYNAFCEPVREVTASRMDVPVKLLDSRQGGHKTRGHEI